MKTGLTLSFENKSLDGEFYSLLFDKFVRFEPYSFTRRNKGEAWDGQKHLALLPKLSIGEEISIIDKNRNFFGIVNTGTQHPHQSVIINQDRQSFFPNNDEIIEVVNLSQCFVAGYLYHKEYTFVQSTVSETRFGDRDIPDEIFATLKNTPFKLGVFGDREYDTRFNPGRQLLIGYTWLMAGWKMWFGAPFFKLVPKDRILSFPHAYKIEELKGGKVFVQLFENIEESHTPDSMFRQWKWQEWLDFDRLEKEYL